MATVRGTILVQQLCGPLRALHLVEQVRAVSQVGLLLRYNEPYYGLAIELLELADPAWSMYAPVYIYPNQS